MWITCQSGEVNEKARGERVHLVDGRSAHLAACEGEDISEQHPALRVNREEERESESERETE